jgi:CheY-like chemotaxis protein
MAEYLADFLSAHGAKVVGPAGRLGPALTLARQAELDGALLDVNLAGEQSFPVAAELIRRDIPFIFLTGYDKNVFPPEAGIDLRTSHVQAGRAGSAFACADHRVSSRAVKRYPALGHRQGLRRVLRNAFYPPQRFVWAAISVPEFVHACRR